MLSSGVLQICSKLIQDISLSKKNKICLNYGTATEFWI